MKKHVLCLFDNKELFKKKIFKLGLGFGRGLLRPGEVQNVRDKMYKLVHFVFTTSVNNSIKFRTFIPKRHP